MKPTAFATIAGCLVMFSTAAAAETPPPGSVTIKSVSYSGSGCPQGSVATGLSPDNQAMTMLFDSYVVDSGETEAAIDRKECTVRVRLNVPKGWEYSLFSVDFRGFADLSEGANAVQSASVRIGSSFLGEFARLEMKGPLVKDYTNSTSALLNLTPWSRCTNGQPEEITINSAAQVTTTGAVTTLDKHLASHSSRLVTENLGSNIIMMTVTKKHSSAKCEFGKSYGFLGKTAWVSGGCRADFKFAFAPGNNPNAVGLLTVDSADGYVENEYGIAWKRCRADWANWLR